MLAAFILTAAVVFALFGASLSTVLAPSLFPDAKQFDEHGGTIETCRLAMYHDVPWVACLGCAALGGVAGRGFYAAWRGSQTDP